MVAVALLALALGIALGHNARPTDADALAAKQQAYAAASKRARIAARTKAYNSGFQEGSETGQRRGKAKGEAAAKPEPTSATGATGSSPTTGGASPTDATGR
jgi:hypothetical protein